MLLRVARKEMRDLEDAYNKVLSVTGLLLFASRSNLGVPPLPSAANLILLQRPARRSILLHSSVTSLPCGKPLSRIVRLAFVHDSSILVQNPSLSGIVVI